MNENYKKLRGNISAERLVEMLNEGLLYVKTSREETISKAVTVVLKKISVINDCCTDVYAPIMPYIWETVLTNILSIRRKIVIGKGSKKGCVNWYQVAAIIHYLCQRGVYDINVSESKLDKMLHGKNAIYHNCVKGYALEFDQIDAINAIIEKCKRNFDL